MTSRERFLKSLSFDDRPDRIFYGFGKPRRSTYAAWYLQGLPRMMENAGKGKGLNFSVFVGEDDPGRGLPVNKAMLPAFEEKILEETEHGQIWRDSLGIVMHDAGKKLNTPGFRTRSYISHPVKDRETWLDMRNRFDPDSPGRYPEGWDDFVAENKDRSYPIAAKILGPYWTVRDWVGFEGLSMMFYDDPKLVHEMMEHVAVFDMAILDRAMRDGMIDYIIISEDMAYKHAAMISPVMYREFMLPRYKRMVRCFKEGGVPLVLVDSDGHIGQLIPLWIEAGIEGTSPVEIAALNDPVEYRKRYGSRIALWGGIDKREIRSREQVYKEVMGKVPWLIEQKGYVPKFDHGVPPDVPLRSFLYMCELIKAIAEGRSVPGPQERLAIEESLGPVTKMWSADMVYDPDEEDYQEG